MNAWTHTQFSLVDYTFVKEPQTNFYETKNKNMYIFL